MKSELKYKKEKKMKKENFLQLGFAVLAVVVPATLYVANHVATTQLVANPFNINDDYTTNKSQNNEMVANPFDIDDNNTTHDTTRESQNKIEKPNYLLSNNTEITNTINYNVGNIKEKRASMQVSQKIQDKNDSYFRLK